MALEKLSYNGSNDEVVTAANTGFTSIDNSDPGGSQVFDDAWSPRGRPSIIMTGSDQTGQLFGRQDMVATDRFAFDIPWRPIVIGSSPNLDNQIFYLGDGENRIFSINLLSTGALRIRDAANVQTNSPAGIIVSEGRYVFAVFVLRHATAGEFHVRVTNEVTGALVWESHKTAQNTGAVNFNRFRTVVGKVGSTSVTPARHAWGEPRWDRAATALLPVWRTYNPFWMWVGGQYVQVDVFRWDAGEGDYVQVGNV